MLERVVVPVNKATRGRTTSGRRFSAKGRSCTDRSPRRLYPPVTPPPSRIRETVIAGIRPRVTTAQS
jgi:hypothetical protein